MPIYRNNGFSMSFGDRLREMWDRQRVLSVLLLLNIGLFLCVKLIGLIMWLFNLGDINALLVENTALPASWPQFLQRPWTLLTYMLLHDNFWQLFFNIWLLVFSSRLFMECLDEMRLVVTYIVGGVLGAVFFLAAYRLFPVLEVRAETDMVIGASASVLAILTAVATYTPDRDIPLFIFGSINIKWVLFAIIAIDLLSFTASVPGECINHAGGVFWGFAYALILKKASYKDSGTDRKGREYTPYEEVNMSDGGRERPLSDEEYNRREAENDREVDAILDKLSKYGYSALSEEEKRFLFEQSKK